MTSRDYSRERSDRESCWKVDGVRVRVVQLIGWIGVAILLSTSANAGGLYANEFSTTSQGNAGAGRGAWAPDASVTLHNPASMTRLDDHALAGGMSLAFSNIRFDAAEGSGSGTESGGNQGGIGPLASFSYVHHVSDRVRFGLTFYSISGSILNPKNDWAGRYQMIELSLLTISLSPTLAIELTDWLSIGGGPIATYGVLNWDLEADFLGSDHRVQLDDFDDWEPAGRVGLLFHPSKDFALSVYYNSKTDFELSGNLKIPSGLSADLDAQLPLAQFVEVSAAWQATDELQLLATFNWEDWSEADHLTISIGGIDRGATTGFQDTYKIGVGANYQLRSDWLLQAGLMFDTSAFKNRDRTVAIPIDQQIRAAIGFQHDCSDTMAIGASFVYLNLGQGEVRKAAVTGDYNRNHAFIFGVTLSFKKLPWSGRLTM